MENLALVQNERSNEVMENKLQVIFNEDKVQVDGRQLHMFLGVKTRYNDWFPRMCEYGFEEGKDFYSNLSKTSSAEQGGRPQINHLLTLDMAKELAMLQRTDKGKEARQYFLQVEKDWNSPEKVMARALKIAQKTLEETKVKLADANKVIEEQKPKVEFFDDVTGSDDTIDIKSVAKILNVPKMGRNKLFAFLRDKNILNKKNEPYQYFVDRGYFRQIESSWEHDGTTHITLKTVVFQKGVDFIRKLLQDERIG